MKIVYIYTSLTTIGGADRIVTQKANYLADELGHEVYIVTDSQNGRRTSFPLSSKVRHIDLGINFDRQYNYPIILRFFIYQVLMRRYKKKLKDFLQLHKPDIVISTLGRDMDFLTSMNDGSLKIGESHIAKPFMRNLHLLEAKGGLYKLMAKYWRKKQEKAISQLDAFVVLTPEDASSWESVRSANVIPNMMTIEPNLLSSCKAKKVVSVGRYCEQKGYDLLIETWKFVAEKHPDWQIDIYGEGELQNQLQKQIEELGLQEQIKLYPPVSDIENKYSESSIYVMSSRFEGFGLVLTEAMNCGLPCISFDCPYGPSRIIQHDEDGLLVENGNVTALAESICYMIEHEDRRITMGQKARQNIQRFSKASIMAKWNNLFQSLLTKQQS